jgi:hypothetical protein
MHGAPSVYAKQTQWQTNNNVSCILIILNAERPSRKVLIKHPDVVAIADAPTPLRSITIFCLSSAA